MGEDVKLSMDQIKAQWEEYLKNPPPITRIPVAPQFILSPEMMERWQQDLRKIIELQEFKTGVLIELRQTQDELEEAETRIKSLETQDVINPLVVSKREHDAVCQERDNLKKACETKQEVIEEIRAENRKVHQERDGFRNQLQEVAKQRQKAWNECDRLRQIINDEQAAVRNADELNQVKGCLAIAENALEETRGERDTLRKQLEAVQKVNENLKNQYQECYRVSQDRLHVIEGMRRDLVEQDEQIKKLTVRSECNKADDKDRQIKALESALSLVGSEKANLERKLMELEKASAQIRLERESACARILNLEAELKKFSANEWKKMNDSLATTRRNLAETEAELQGALKNSEQLKKESNTYQDANVRLHDQFDRVTRELENRLAKRDKEMDNLSVENDRLHNAVITLNQEIERLRGEVAIQHEERQKAHDVKHRLLAGNFTEEEFQALCHRFQDADCQRFCKGCLDYWVNLFGKDKLTPVLVNAAKEIIESAQLKWVNRDHSVLMGQDQHIANIAFAEDVVASLFELYTSRCEKEESHNLEAEVRGLPLPIIHQDFEFTMRTIEAERKQSNTMELME